MHARIHMRLSTAEVVPKIVGRLRRYCRLRIERFRRHGLPQTVPPKSSQCRFLIQACVKSNCTIGPTLVIACIKPQRCRDIRSRNFLFLTRFLRTALGLPNRFFQGQQSKAAAQSCPKGHGQSLLPPPRRKRSRNRASGLAYVQPDVLRSLLP
jgi:hypothetical protein